MKVSQNKIDDLNLELTVETQKLKGRSLRSASATPISRVSVREWFL